MDVVVEDRLAGFRELLRQRRGPVVYILDEGGDVVMTAPGDPPLPEEARHVVDAVLLEADAGPGEIRPAFRLDAGLSIRVQPVGGTLGRFTVVLIELFRLRDHLAAGRKRYALTQREAEVLQGVMRGTRTADIAAELGIAASTVAGHIQSIMSKTSTRSRAEMLGRILADLSQPPEE